MFIPFNSIEPLVSPVSSLPIKFAMVDLPEPDLPIIAICLPASTLNEISFKQVFFAPEYAKLTFLKTSDLGELSHSMTP